MKNRPTTRPHVTLAGFHLWNERRIFFSEEFLASEEVFTSTAEFCWVNFSLFFLLWNYGIAVTFCFFYAFVDIVIRLFDIDLSLLIRFSVIEVKQKEVVTVASVRYSCKTSKTSKMNSNIFLVKKKNGSILIEKIITHRKGPFNDCQYAKIIYMWTAVEEITMKAILAVMNTT